MIDGLVYGVFMFHRKAGQLCTFAQLEEDTAKVGDEERLWTMTFIGNKCEGLSFHL